MKNNFIKDTKYLDKCYDCKRLSACEALYICMNNNGEMIDFSVMNDVSKKCEGKVQMTVEEMEDELTDGEKQNVNKCLYYIKFKLEEMRNKINEVK